MFSQSAPAPAPVDETALADSLRPFGESRMLPRDAYVSEAVFHWERQHLFDRNWFCVARSEDVAVPGDQRAESVGTSGVLLTRADDGVVRAFANACRHRGHELVSCGETTHRAGITCPYHAWTYDLRGDLVAARGFKGTEGFDPAEFGLVELAAAEWAGLVFVDPTGSAGSFLGHLGGLAEIVAPYEPERLVTAQRHRYEIAANWKIVSENYHECYHCPMIHPQLCDVSPPQSGENYHPDGGAWVGGWMELREGMTTMALDGQSPVAPLRAIVGEARRHVVYVNVFPNVLLSLHPDYVMTHRLTPLSAGRTLIECSWSFAPEAKASDGFDPGFAVEFWDITNRQDWRACESVQRGLSSPMARPGPLSSEEEAVYRFVTMIARAYRGEPVRNLAEALPVR